LGSTLLTALSRGEVKQLLAYNEEEKKPEEKKE
jgi:hypothetical protein